MRTIRKIGLLVVRDGRLLVVRKRGGTLWILPGGKPEPGESDEQALNREVREELSCDIAWSRRWDEIAAPAADLPDVEVVVACHIGEISGSPVPTEEIEELAWVDMRSPELPLAISIAEHMIPRLLAEGSDT